MRKAAAKARSASVTIGVTRFDDVTEPDGVRTRFRGQGRHRRGRIAGKTIDDQDLKWARDAIDKARDGLVLASDPSLSRLERDSAVRAAQAHWRHAASFVQDVDDRHPLREIDRLPARAQGGKRK